MSATESASRQAFTKPSGVSEQEWKLRVDLAACYRLMAHYGWDDLIFTHLSVRVPGPKHHFLINPYGLMFQEITASSLVKVDVDGELVEDAPGHGINPAGFTIHSAIHMAREDAQAVLHLHARDAVAVSAQEDGLLPISQTAMLVYSRAAYHDYEGVALDLGERERLVRDLGDKDVLILRNHGVLTVGNTVPEAFILMYFLVKACEIQVSAQHNGKPRMPSPDAIETTRRQSLDRMPETGKRAWPALLRMLEHEDPSYKT